MPTLFASEGFKICVFRDHRPPHVHVFGGDGRSAKIALEDGRLIGGNIRAREYKRALRWLIEHEREVRDRWRELNS
jgi:Domain of unknown function (DUF4160)